MKKHTIMGVALLLAMLMTLTASHATSHIQPIFAGKSSSQEAPPQGLMGKVVAVDTAKSELAVKDEKGAEKTMSVAPTTKITKEEKDIALAEIKAGDRVMYELDAASDPPVAKSLLVMSAKPAKP